MQEDGKWFYYQNNERLTGIHELPSNVSGESGNYFYDLGDDGASKGKISGLFTLNGNLYFAENGRRITGWKAISYPGGRSKLFLQHLELCCAGWRADRRRLSLHVPESHSGSRRSDSQCQWYEVYVGRLLGHAAVVHG